MDVNGLVLGAVTRAAVARAAVTRAAVALAVLVLGAGALAAPVCAQAPSDRAAPHVVWIAGSPGPDAVGRARRWQRRVARAIDSRGGGVSLEAESWAHGPPGVERSRVARLARVEDLLRDSREHRARLEPARAMELLVEAERIALGSLDVPGASAWYAEVEIALAVAAHENGDGALAGEALARAASVDPARVLGAAEAPPDLLARAQAIVRAAATAPRARFEIRTSVPATVWLDTTRLGESPLRVEASAGAHVVRVEASGHRTWARLLDVLEGGRPPLESALSPEPTLEAARALRSATDAGALDRVAASLAALASLGGAPRALWLVEVSEGAIDRAIVVVCREARCDAPIRVDSERVESVLPVDPAVDPETLEPDGADGLTARGLALARDWLEEPIPVEPPPPPAPEWWQEPWPWAIAGVVIAGAIAGAIGASYQPPAPREQTTITVPPGFPWRAE